MASNNPGSSSSTARHQSDRSFVMTRTFDAPRSLVFKLWSDSEDMKHWWGPKGSIIGVFNMDFRPGGTLLYSVRLPEGGETWGKFVYREILPPDRLVFIHSFSDETGKTSRAPFSPTWPLEIETTVSLSERFAKTNLALLARPINATDDEWSTFESSFDSVHKAFSGSFDRLTDYLAKV
jgi:uncharacterized protein YndB with AHSA1/START domain